MKRKKEMTFSQRLIIEFISIIMAVILGFVVNEYRENHNRKLEADLALKRISKEIEQNDSLLVKGEKYFSRMVFVFDSLITNNPNAPYDEKSIPGWQGIGAPGLSSSAYKTAVSTGIFSFVDFETADIISRLYLIQDKIDQFNTEALNSTVKLEILNNQSLKILFNIYRELTYGWIMVHDMILSTISNQETDEK